MLAGSAALRARSSASACPLDGRDVVLKKSASAVAKDSALMVTVLACFSSASVCSRSETVTAPRTTRTRRRCGTTRTSMKNDETVHTTSTHIRYRLTLGFTLCQCFVVLEPRVLGVRTAARTPLTAMTSGCFDSLRWLCQRRNATVLNALESLQGSGPEATLQPRHPKLPLQLLRPRRRLRRTRSQKSRSVRLQGVHRTPGDGCDLAVRACLQASPSHDLTRIDMLRSCRESEVAALGFVGAVSRENSSRKSAGNVRTARSRILLRVSADGRHGSTRLSTTMISRQSLRTWPVLRVAEASDGLRTSVSHTLPAPRLLPRTMPRFVHVCRSIHAEHCPKMCGARPSDFILCDLSTLLLEPSVHL